MSRPLEVSLRYGPHPLLSLYIYATTINSITVNMCEYYVTPLRGVKRYGPQPPLISLFLRHYNK